MARDERISHYLKNKTFKSLTDTSSFCPDIILLSGLTDVSNDHLLNIEKGHLSDTLFIFNGQQFEKVNSFGRAHNLVNLSLKRARKDERPFP
jgi:hypothetical protein